VRRQSREWVHLVIKTTLKQGHDRVEGRALLQTAIVEGPLAFQMRRVAAARADECGLQILSLPQLAARLVGGFAQAITPEILEPAIQTALSEKGFKEIEQV
jgi:hypothetical protein